MKALLDQISVFAVRGSVQPGVPFDAAPVVGRDASGRSFELARFVGGFAEGTELAPDELDAAVGCGEMTRFEPAPARAGIQGWIYESPAEAAAVQQKLEGAGAWVSSRRANTGTVLVVSRPDANVVRGQLHALHLEQAKAALVGDVAMKHARRAWLLAQPVRPIDVAVLVLAHRLSGLTELGHALRQMERNSHGDVFDRAVGEELALLEAQRPRRIQALQRRALQAAEPGQAAA